MKEEVKEKVENVNKRFFEQMEQAILEFEKNISNICNTELSISKICFSQGC